METSELNSLTFSKITDTVSYSFGDNSLNAKTLGGGGSFPEGKLYLLEQTHSAEFIEVDPSSNLNSQFEADGWLVDGTVKGIFGIKTADCFPVICYSAKPELFLNLHIGWRGLVGGLLHKTLCRMIELGACASEIKVKIGPRARECCYEVRADVIDKLKEMLSSLSLDISEDKFRELSAEREKAGVFYPKLTTFLSLQARSLGVPLENIASIDNCTVCNQTYFSHRREGKQSGRQLSLLVVK